MFQAHHIDSLKSGSQAAEALSTSLMVCPEGGKDFRVVAETHVPFLQLSTFQADLKDRYEIRLTLVPEKLKSGPVNGSIARCLSVRLSISKPKSTHRRSC